MSICNDIFVRNGLRLNCWRPANTWTALNANPFPVGFFGKVSSLFNALLTGIFKKLYLLISTVLFLDTWLLQTSASDVTQGRRKRKFLLWLLILLPFLLFGGKSPSNPVNQFSSQPRELFQRKTHTKQDSTSTSIPPRSSPCAKCSPPSATPCNSLTSTLSCRAWNRCGLSSLKSGTERGISRAFIWTAWRCCRRMRSPRCRRFGRRTSTVWPRVGTLVPWPRNRWSWLLILFF